MVKEMLEETKNETSKAIRPENITKPIQLLAAWLVGLVATNATFLATATVLPNGDWARSMLLIAAVANVPVFLISMFLLQTKFRPELQEDYFYSNYIMNNKGKITVGPGESKQIPHAAAIPPEFSIATSQQADPIESEGLRSEFDFLKYSVAMNDYIGNFREIKKHLEDRGIPIGATFGRSNDQPEPPERWVISIDKNLDKSSLVYFLHSIQAFSGQFAGFFLESRKAGDGENIFIGGYITDRPLLPINDAIIERLQRDTNQ